MMQKAKDERDDEKFQVFHDKCDSVKSAPQLPAGSYRTFGVRICSISKNRLVTSLDKVHKIGVEQSLITARTSHIA
jgi:hypothetical protein